MTKPVSKDEHARASVAAMAVVLVLLSAFLTPLFLMIGADLAGYEGVGYVNALGFSIIASALGAAWRGITFTAKQ